MKKVFSLLLIAVLMMMGCTQKTEKESISVYMLTENEQLINGMQSYSQAHPELSLTFEFGIEDTFGTSSEATKKLNTRLLSEEGPDILILDDIQAKSYAETGLLSEITGIITEKENLPPNLTDSYRIRDKIYYMPLAVTLISQTQGADESVDFSDAVTLIEDIRSQNLDIRNTGYENLSAILYRSEIEPYIKNYNSVEREKLESFYQALADLRPLYGDRAPFASYEQTNLKVNHLNQYLKIANGEADAGVDYIDTIFGAQALYSLKRQGLIDFRFKKDEASFQYIPQGIIAINAESEHQEAAQQLVAYLFSDEGQKKLLENELIPIDLQVVEESYQTQHQYDMNGVLTIYPWEKEDGTAFLEVLKNLNEPLWTDANLMEIVMNGAKAYINGESSLNEALDNTMNKLEIYLAE